MPVIDNSRLGKWLSTDDKPAAEAEEPEPVEEFVELTKEEMEERKQKAEEIIKRNQMTQEELDEVEDRIGELEVRDPADVPVWGKIRVNFKGVPVKDITSQSFEIGNTASRGLSVILVKLRHPL